MTQNDEHTHPLLARVSIPVNIPEHSTEEEMAVKLKDLGLAGHWTAATYTQGPTGTIVDTPGGWDVDVN